MSTILYLAGVGLAAFAVADLTGNASAGLLVVAVGLLVAAYYVERGPQ